eukprot:Rmarinus@m.9097
MAEDEAATNKAIEEELEKDRRGYENEIKLLLIGPGESGKSTVFKQMKIVMLNGFSEEERLAFRRTISDNVLENMNTLIEGAASLGQAVRCHDEVARVQAAIEDRHDIWHTNIASDIQTLWKDAGIKVAYAAKSSLQLNDSAAYYFDRLPELSQPDYLPTVDDVLHVRKRTSGIQEMQYDFGEMRFHVIDVGGQQNERRKWIHYFENVDAVIFCVGLSEYDQTLRENASVNRMHDALNLFNEICNAHWFRHTSMILFLNKSDLFLEKMKKVDLQTTFPDYTGGHNYEAGLEFLQRKFLQLNENPDKRVYVHVTNATDTDQMRFVFEAVKDILLRENLLQSGLM